MSMTYAQIQDRVEQVLPQSSFQFHNFKGLFCYLLLGIPQFLLEAGVRYVKRVIRQQLKVFYSIVIPNSVLMVNNLPWQKTSIQAFSHYKAMFTNVSPAICHRVKEIITLQSHYFISIFIKIPTAFPHRILLALNPITVSTLIASWLTPIQKNPTLFTALNARLPNYRSRLSGFITYRSTIPNYFPQSRHITIITH